MSPYYHGKKIFDHGEIVDILKRNVTLYKDGPGFAEYIATLSLYLAEQYHQEAFDEAMRDKNAQIVVDTQDIGTTMHVSRGIGQSLKDNQCSLCGTQCIEGEKNCPNCGNPL